MHRPTRLKLADLNPLFTCLLCGGYFVDATTIIECLHSFCRACIVRYLDTSKFCPVCDVQVHKTKPLLSIRSDNTLQNIVYKLVPGLYQNEMKRRREFYAEHPEEAARCSSEERGVETNQRFIYSADEGISLSLEYATENVEAVYSESLLEDSNGSGDGSTSLLTKKRYLRCPAAVTIGHLKKFIKLKYDLPAAYKVEISYSHDILNDDYTLMDVAYIYSWKRCGPMCFSYKITEQSTKRQKISHVVENSKISSLEESISEAVNSHPQVMDTQTITNTVPEMSGSIKSTKLTTKLRKLSSKKIKKSRRRKKYISSVKKLRIVPLSSKAPDVPQNSSDQPVSANVSDTDGISISCVDSTNAEIVAESHHVSDISAESVRSNCSPATSSPENHLTNSIPSSTNVPVINSVCSSSSSVQNTSVHTDVLSTPHSSGGLTTVSSCESLVSKSSATFSSNQSLSVNSSTSYPTLALSSMSGASNSAVVSNTSIAVVECPSDKSTEFLSRSDCHSSEHQDSIPPAATNGVSASVVTSVDNPSIAVSDISQFQNNVASSSEKSVMISSLPLTSVVSTNTLTAEPATSVSQRMNSTANVARFASNPNKSTPVPIAKSIEGMPSSAAKSVQNATVSSNPPLRFTLSSNYSMKPAGNSIPSSVGHPPQSVMLISSTRPTLAPISNPAVSSVPGLIVCPTTSIAVCSAPNMAVISSKTPAFPVVPQAVVRSKRGRPPGRRGKNAHLRGGKKFSPQVTNGLPMNPLECSPTVGSVNKHATAFTLQSPVSQASCQTTVSVSAVTVSPALPSTHSFSSELLVTRSSTSSAPACSPSSSVVSPSVTSSIVCENTNTVSSVEAPLVDNVPSLPSDTSVTSNATSITTSSVSSETLSLQQMCGEKKTDLTSEKLLIHSGKQSEKKSEKAEISPSNQKEIIAHKETSHVTVTTKTSPKKEENITLKITVKKSLYQADFSDNDDLGCQPDLVVDEEKIDNSDDEADEALHEKIRAIAEKDDEAEATDDADSGRASDISSQARSTCDDDIGSPLPITRTPDVETSTSTHTSCSPLPPSSIASLPVPSASIPSQITSASRESSRTAKPNGIAHIISNLHRYHEPKKDNVGALDLSVSHRKPEQEPQSRPRQRPVANPPVLDLKHRLPTCLSAPTKQHTSSSPKNSSVPSAHRNTAVASSPSHHRTIPPSLSNSPSTSHPSMTAAASTSHYSVVPTTSAFPYTTMASSSSSSSSSHRSTSSHRHSSSSHRNTVQQQPTNHIPAADTSSLRNLLTTPVPSPPAYKLGPPSIPIYKKTDSYRNSHHRFKGSNLTVINPDPNGYRQKIVIKNLDPRPSNHSHHHHRL